MNEPAPNTERLSHPVVVRLALSDLARIDRDADAAALSRSEKIRGLIADGWRYRQLQQGPR